MLKRRTALLAAALMLCSCGSQTQKTSTDISETVQTEQAEEKRKIAVSLPTDTQERWLRDGKYMEEFLRKNGCEVYLSFEDNDIERQIENIDKYIDNGAEIIVVAPVEMDGLTEILKKASKKKVKVVAYDRLIMDTENVSYYVSFDNYKVGELQAEYIKNALELDKNKDTFRLEILSGDENDLNSEFFYDGAMKILEPYIDGGRLVVTSGLKTLEETAVEDWKIDSAKENFTKVLDSAYNGGDRPDAILCANDTLAIGAVEALEEHKINGSVIITGQDGDEANLANIIDGKQSMTVYKNNFYEAQAACGLCIALMNGQKPDDRIIEINGWEFECKYSDTTYDNGVKKVPSFLLTPESIDKDNMKERLIDTGYYAYDENGYPRAQ